MKRFLLLILVVISMALNAEILIPMGESQTNHLKAYGVAFYTLAQGTEVQWLLNYRGGSFLIPEHDYVVSKCNIMGVSYEMISSAESASIFQTIQENNMEAVKLEKEPSIAVYAPPNFQPWDDAVTMALTYAEIPFTVLWDDEVLTGQLKEYDWLHLHHEDFTGQYGKFYSSYRNTEWYQTTVAVNETMAKKHGYDKVWKLKHAIASQIKSFVSKGGFLFAMCAAVDTIDIALAALNVDIVPPEFDGDAYDPNYKQKLDYDNTFAFENFRLIMNPTDYEFSNIDASNYAKLRGAEADYFQLFSFSAKYDPVPTMLTQCHVNMIDGFLGQTTSFQKKTIKESVILLAEVPGAEEAKYLHGNLGKGTFTFYGGHDPEDYQHRIGDPETILELHKHSPGYRLILNNVLFPAAEKKKLKT